MVFTWGPQSGCFYAHHPASARRWQGEFTPIFFSRYNLESTFIFVPILLACNHMVVRSFWELGKCNRCSREPYTKLKSGVSCIKGKRRDNGGWLGKWNIYVYVLISGNIYTHKSRMSKMVYLQRLEGGSGRSVWRIGNKVTWNEKERLWFHF